MTICAIVDPQPLVQGEAGLAADDHDREDQADEDGELQGRCARPDHAEPEVWARPPFSTVAGRKLDWTRAG